MQILLSTDPRIDGREAMYEHLESVVMEVLGPLGHRLIRVDACLTDAHGSTRVRPIEICCTLEARLLGREPVVARHGGGTASQAIHGALRKLQCLLAHELEDPWYTHRRPAHARQIGAQRAVAASL